MASILESASSQAEERAAKRRRIANNLSEFHFHATIASRMNFATLIYSLNNILPECKIYVLNNSRFKGLKIDSTAPGLVCMLKSVFACAAVSIDDTPETKGGKKTSFCVNLKRLSKYLQACRGSIVELYQRKGDARITLDCPETNPRRTYTMSTLDIDFETHDLNDLSTKYQIQFPVNEIKDFTRLIDNVGCRHFTINVETSEHHVDYDEDQRRVAHTFVTLLAEGDHDRQSFGFYSRAVLENEDTGEMRICCTDNISDASKRQAKALVRHTYKDSFSVSYVNLFFKNLENSSVWMNLSDDGPLILHYSLGSEMSYMRLVLAPRTNDDE